MRLRLRDWGYEASREGCQEWLRKYCRSGGSTEGNAAVYELYRQDLRGWYYVDQLSPTDLQTKLVQRHGVYADRAHLVAWLKRSAQQPDTLDNNERIHGNPCGEYALQRLQVGARPADVAADLLREYVI